MKNIHAIYILLLMLLLSCTSKKDRSVQAITNSLSTYDNHPTLEISETEYLQWVDSVLEVKGVKLIDYRNGIYQYGDTRFYWNRTFDYFLVYPSNFKHGEEPELGDGNHFVNEDSTIRLYVYATYFDALKDDYLLHEWFDIMIDSEVVQGNFIEKKNVTDHSYIIEEKTKNDKCFYSKSFYKMAYEREAIVVAKFEYTDLRRKEVEEIVNLYINKNDNKCNKCKWE